MIQISETLPPLPDDDSDRGTKTEAPPPKNEKEGLRERAYKLRFDPSAVHPPDEECMSLGRDYSIAARGNVSAIQGKSKVGKSAVVAAILGAAQRGKTQTKGDCLCFEWVEDSAGAIIHLDSEQSLFDWHSLVARSIHRSGMGEASPRLVSLPLVVFSRAERMQILQQTLEFEHERNGVDLVVIDGVADLCLSPNDEGESLEIIAKLMAMAQTFRCAIFLVLHENPSAEGGKTRGHLGSELNRKAFGNVRIDKDENGVSTIWGSDMRKREIPKDQGFCFQWSDALGMHSFIGRAGGVKAAERNEKAVTDAREFFGDIFDHLAETGQNDPSTGQKVLGVTESGGHADLSCQNSFHRLFARIARS